MLTSGSSGDVVLVERKTWADLAKSLSDGRYAEQKARLLSAVFAGAEDVSDEAEVAEVEAAAPAWNLNTFLRWSHYNAERDENMRFEGDRHGSGWRPGDFAGHCSGLSPLRRALCVAVLIGAVIS